MKRMEWEFYFSPVDMMQAAEKKVIYHEGRVRFWSEQLEQAQKDQKSNDEQFASVPQKMSSTYSNMQSHAELRVNDCKAKVVQHTGHVSEFKRWAELFKRSTDGFQLKYADVEYFDVLAVVSQPIAIN